MSHGYKLFLIWTILLLIAIFAYKGSEMGIIQQAANDHERAFIIVLVAAVLTIGIGGELLLQHCSFKWILLAVFYLAATCTFLHTSMRANRPRLTQRVYSYEAKHRFAHEHPRIRDRAGELRTTIQAKLTAITLQLASIQAQVNAKSTALQGAKERFRILAPMLPRQDRKSKRAEMVGPPSAEFNRLALQRDVLKGRVNRMERILLRCEALMKPNLRRPLAAKEMDEMTLAARDELHAIEKAMGVSLGRPGDPLILPVTYEQLSPMQLYLWAIQHPIDKEVMPLWKALLLNLLLSVSSMLIGHLAHVLRHQGRNAKVVTIGNQAQRASRVA